MLEEKGAITPTESPSYDVETPEAIEVNAPATLKGYPASWKLSIITFSLCLGTFLVALDVNIIGVAVPKITSVFNSLDDVSWYAAAYLLTLTALQPSMGFLYKTFNVRVIYLSNIFIFEVGSVLCAAAPTSATFILGRAVAGFGAAGLLQGALAIIALIVELERRPMLMGIVISVFGLSICVGPVMGGAFIDSVSWRWCFWINLPIGAVALIIILLFLRVHGEDNQYKSLPFRTKLSKMDWLGTILFLGTICSLVLALQWGGQKDPWNSSTIIGLLVGAGLLATAFTIVQYYRGEDALIPRRVLQQRSIFGGTAFLFFIGMFNYTYSFYLPFYFQAAQGVLPVTSGVRIIPFVLCQIVFIGLTGAIVTRWGHYMPYVIGGMLICVVGAGLITRLEVSTPIIQWAAFLCIAGIGLGTAMQLPYTALQVVLSEADVPTGNAIFVFFNQLGGIIAIPISQALMLSSIRSQAMELLPGLDPNVIINAGASNLNLVAGSSLQTLQMLRAIYAEALTKPYILALCAACAATLCVPIMEWKNIKKEAASRKGKLQAEGNEKAAD